MTNKARDIHHCSAIFKILEPINRASKIMSPSQLIFYKDYMAFLSVFWSFLGLCLPQQL